MATGTETQKAHAENTELIPVALDNILRSSEGNDWSAQETEHYLQ